MTTTITTDNVITYLGEDLSSRMYGSTPDLTLIQNHINEGVMQSQKWVYSSMSQDEFNDLVLTTISCNNEKRIGDTIDSNLAQIDCEKLAVLFEALAKKRYSVSSTSSSSSTNSFLNYKSGCDYIADFDNNLGEYS